MVLEKAPRLGQNFKRPLSKLGNWKFSPGCAKLGISINFPSWSTAAPKVRLAPVDLLRTMGLGGHFTLTTSSRMEVALAVLDPGRCTLFRLPGEWLHDVACDSLQSEVHIPLSWPRDISSPQVVFCARLLRAACLAQQIAYLCCPHR